MKRVFIFAVALCVFFITFEGYTWGSSSCMDMMNRCGAQCDDNAKSFAHRFACRQGCGYAMKICNEWGGKICPANHAIIDDEGGLNFITPINGHPRDDVHKYLPQDPL